MCTAQLLGAVVTVAICLPLTTSTVTTVWILDYRGVWGQKTRCWLQMVTALPTPGPGRAGASHLISSSRLQVDTIIMQAI